MAVSDFASITGKGVTGMIGGRKVALGNAALLRDLGVADRRAGVAGRSGCGATARR